MNHVENAKRMNTYKRRLLDDGTVADVRAAIERDLERNIGDTVYVRARTLIRQHDLAHRARHVGVALAALDGVGGLSVRQSNPDAQQSRWTITREVSADGE